MRSSEFANVSELNVEKSLDLHRETILTSSKVTSTSWLNLGQWHLLTNQMLIPAYSMNCALFSGLKLRHPQVLTTDGSAMQLGVH